MRIGELADQLGLNPKTIRYYEDIALIPPAERTPSGYRVYGPEDAERLTFIKTAQRLGLALDEIREVLALRERGEAPCAYVRGVVRREVDSIDRRIEELRRLRNELAELDELADSVPEADGAVCRLIEHVRRRASEIEAAPGLP